MFVQVETEECGQRLDATFVEDGQVALIQGERRQLELWINNTGAEGVSEIWVVSGLENIVWIENPAAEKTPGKTLAIEGSGINSAI